MKKKISIILIFAFNFYSFGQDSELKECYKIKYLDFFGLDQMEIIKWSESQIDGLLKIDFNKDRGNSSTKTSFIIPTIVYQLKEYHPTCKTNIDSTYLNKITRVYFKIRDLNMTHLSGKSIPEKIDFMRNDFYKQVENVKYLPQMTMTFDDGPFYGVDFEEKTELESIKIQETNFGLLSVSRLGDKTILTSENKKGKVLWQKSITGLLDRNLPELHFKRNPMEYNSVATVAHMYSGGERFTLYLKKNGDFMYYFHSW